jgi:hypothetical protein
MNKRGDKDRLAGARKSGNAKPDRRIEQMNAKLGKSLSRQTDLFN